MPDSGVFGPLDQVAFSAIDWAWEASSFTKKEMTIKLYLRTRCRSGPFQLAVSCSIVRRTALQSRVSEGLEGPRYSVHMEPPHGVMPGAFPMSVRTKRRNRENPSEVLRNLQIFQPKTTNLAHGTVTAQGVVQSIDLSSIFA